MAYTSNEKDNLMKEGEYECIIEDIREIPFQSDNNKVYLSITYRVRNDVEQEYRNKVIFEALFKNKETQDYNSKRIGSLLFCSGMEKGQSVDNINGVIDFCKGRFIRVVVGIIHDEYSDKEKNVVKFYKPTQTKNETLKVTAPLHKDSVPDDELPF